MDSWGSQPIAQQPLKQEVKQEVYGAISYDGSDAQEWYQDSYGQMWKWNRFLVKTCDKLKPCPICKNVINDSWTIGLELQPGKLTTQVKKVVMWKPKGGHWL